MPSYRRSFGIAAGALVLVWLAWEIVSTTAADTLADIRPQAALSWRSDVPVALARAAGQKLMGTEKEPPLELIEAMARRALRATPLETDALRLLALAADRRGESGRAASVMKAAAMQAPRDMIIRGWLLAKAVDQQSFDEVVENLDAMLRTRPEIRRYLLPTLIVWVQQPMAQSALVERLALSPPWRMSLLTELSRQAPDTDVVSRIYAKLKATAAPPSEAEVKSLLGRLLKNNQVELAYLTWLDFLPPERLASVARLANGDFETPVSGLPFDWLIERADGAVAEIVGTGEDDNHVLRVTFHGNRAPFRHVSQILVLPPGRYRLSGEVRAEFDSQRGLQWTVSCLGAGELLGATELVAGARTWDSFSLDFLVPPSQVCRGQRLRLEMAARVPAEQEAKGAVWYDNISVAQAPAGPGPEAANVQ